MKYIIIGGVAGGATAAARIRRIDEESDIILLEQGKHISYANCGLPYYIGGIIEEESKLLIQTPTSFGNRFYVDVRVQNQVLAIESNRKTLSIRKANGKIYEEKYDKLLLSPGANAIRPELEGIDNEGIFTLRNVEDTQRIKAYALSRQIQNAVVIGGGFIGLEMAENLRQIGANVSIVETASQVMAPLDYSIAAHVHRHLLDHGVHLYLNQAVQRFSKVESNGQEIDRPAPLSVHLSGGNQLQADLVLLCIGVRPQSELAQSAGIRLGSTGGIVVDKYLETSVKDIYAVGDAIEFPHPLTGIPYLNYLAGPANRQGRIVADNMVRGNTTTYEGAIGSCIAKVFDLTVAATGLSAKKLKQLGIPYCTSTTHHYSHATYYPCAQPFTLKLTYNPESGKIFGAQGVGYDGVDKRMDQLALLIKLGGTVYDLAQVEHTYAPPYSSAKDPVVIAGYVAGNVLSGAMQVVTWRGIATADPRKVFLLDVRSLEEFEQGSIAGAVHIPLDELRERLDEIPDDKEIFVFCAIGLRGYLAQQILKANGFSHVRNLTGGYRTYAMATAPLQ